MPLILFERMERTIQDLMRELMKQLMNINGEKKKQLMNINGEKKFGSKSFGFLRPSNP